MTPENIRESSTDKNIAVSLSEFNGVLARTAHSPLAFPCSGDQIEPPIVNPAVLVEKGVSENSFSL